MVETSLPLNWEYIMNSKKLEAFIMLVMDKFGDNKKIVGGCLVALGFIIFASMVLAMPANATGNGNGGNQDHTCQGGHNCNEGGGGAGGDGGDGGAGGNQTQGQAQQQGQAQSAEATGTGIGVGVGIGKGGSSDQTQNAVAISGGGRGGQANSDSTSNSDSISNSTANSDSSSSSTSSGNTVSVSNGATDVVTTTGDNSAATGDTTVTVEGDTIEEGDYTYSFKSEHAAASAANVWAGVCQNGGSGQTRDGGFSIVQSDALCDHLKVAAVMWDSYQRELERCPVICVGVCTKKYASVEQEQVCDNDRTELYLELYHENLMDANDLAQSAEFPATLDRIAGNLIRPLGILALLLML